MSNSFQSVLFGNSIFILLTVITFSVSAQSNNSIKNAKEKEKLILSRLNHLPEVAQFLKAHKSSKAELLIARTPDETFKYYWVKLGVGNFDIFRTSTNYYVDPKSFHIYFIDDMDTSGMAILPIKQWRKIRSDPKFYKPHTFKNGNMITVTPTVN
jgi:hypothetical protein